MIAGQWVVRADGRHQQVLRVLTGARSGRSGTTVPITVLELSRGAGQPAICIDHYGESARLKLARLTGRPDYPAAEPVRLLPACSTCGTRAGFPCEHMETRR